MSPDRRPVALITGASRRGGIAAAIAQALAADGWDVALTYWHAYDARVHPASDPADVAWLRARMEACGTKTSAIEADLSHVESATAIFDATERALTSDHFVGNVPYGASKGALNRIVLAAAREFAERGITANVIDPGPTDTGWITDEQRADFIRRTPGGRVGRPEDCANIVRFLCSPDGAWVNGQVIHSNGGLSMRLW